MTKTTFTNLKKTFIEKNPVDWFTDLFDSVSYIDDISDTDDIPGVADAGTGYAIFVSKAGHDTNGDGGKVNPYLTIAKALTQADSDKAVVYVEPGTYTENLTWPTLTAFRLIGLGRRGAVTIADASDGGTAVVQMAAGTAFGAVQKCWMENLELDHNGTGLHVNDTTMEENVLVYLKNVSTVATGGTSILTTGGNANDAIQIYIDGQQDEIAGPIYLQFKNASDIFQATNMKLTGGLESSADALAAEITFKSCELLHEGVSGGEATQVANAINCWSLTGSTYAMLDTADLGGSHTENLIPDPGTAWTAQ